MPRQETKADLRQRIEHWKQQYEQSCREKREQERQFRDELSKAWDDVRNANYRFTEAQNLWNEWVEADKGDGGPETRLAFARWEPNTFRKLLALLRPYDGMS